MPPTHPTEPAGAMAPTSTSRQPRVVSVDPLMRCVHGRLLGAESASCGLPGADRLKREIGRRLMAEHELEGEREALERRVDERTRQLATANAVLAREVEIRTQAQYDLVASEARERLARERLLHAIDSLADALALFDPGQRLVLCNLRFRELHASIAPLLKPGTPYAFLLRAAAEKGLYGDVGDVGAWLAERLRQVREGVESGAMQDAAGRHFLLRSSRTPEGEMVSLCTDVTELKQAEAELTRRNELLAAANADLERYARIVSHDLRSPLRGVRHIVDWIEEDGEQRTQQQLDEYLGLIRRQIGRLERMLDDLLDYSRVGHGGAPAEEVDLDELLAETVRLLGPRQGFRIVPVGRLGRARFVAVELALMLRNAIDNAIKHHDRKTGLIEVAAAQRDGWLELEIRDDGPGIPVELHERAFAMFATLRPRDQVEGTGLGLSMIRRIARQRGGEVSIISAPPARGTTLRLTLPQPRDAAA